MSTEYHFGDEIVQYGPGNIGMIKYQGPASPVPPADPAAAMRRSFDVCLIIPLREEFDCARDILHFDDPISDGSYFLHPFSIPGSSVTGIAVVLFGVGLASSAVAATHLLSSYDIRVLALVGIAGALSPELHLGDVVIASSVDEYLHGAKVRPDATGRGVEFELGGTAWQATPEIVTFATTSAIWLTRVPGSAHGANAPKAAGIPASPQRFQQWPMTIPTTWSARSPPVRS